VDKQPRGIEQLVESQIRLWMANQEAKKRGPSAAEGGAPTRAPPVTVSREFGALGEQLARLLAERMSFSCWDTELLSAIAQSTQAPMRLLEALDEHRRTGIEKFVEMWTPSGAPSDTEYRRELVRVIHAIAAQGAAVIVGRGSQAILHPEEALHVRVIAPLSTRVEGLMARRAWSEAQARQEIARVEDDRRAFLRSSFGRDPEDPHLYDMVINVGRLPLERAVQIVEAAWKAKFGR
jgi:cytidylate kinase